MNKFKITLENIQHIKYLEYEIDLSCNALHCIVGKNGVGKTTFIKAIQNFVDTNALDNLSRLNIISDQSKIIYELNGNLKYELTPIFYDNKYVLDIKGELSKEQQAKIHTELPLPNGKRFDFFSRLGGDIGEAIKKAFSIGEYQDKPTELIALLNRVYADPNRFNALEQIDYDGRSYYIKPISSENYIREDDFSSGEYMLIQIYKLIKTGCKLIVIDELDISLDSSAQINLIKELRTLAESNDINIIFTTHSLAIMKILNENELFYMEEKEDCIVIENKSYNYIKSLLFQFEGYDRIILTEDRLLVGYIEYLLKDENIFSKYKIIDIAGHSQTVDLMERNKSIKFLGTDKVLTILDGDQSGEAKYQQNDIKFVPFDSIEKELRKAYEDAVLEPDCINCIDQESYDKAKNQRTKARVVYYCITSKGKMTATEIIEWINARYSSHVEALKVDILAFLESSI